MTDYQICVAERAEAEYGLYLRVDAVEAPDRDGRIYCQSQYIATAPIVYDEVAGEWRRTGDVGRFRFDRGGRPGA